MIFHVKGSKESFIEILKRLPSTFACFSKKKDLKNAECSSIESFAGTKCSKFCMQRRDGFWPFYVASCHPSLTIFGKFFWMIWSSQKEIWNSTNDQLLVPCSNLIPLSIQFMNVNSSAQLPPTTPIVETWSNLVPRTWTRVDTVPRQPGRCWGVKCLKIQWRANPGTVQWSMEFLSMAVICANKSKNTWPVNIIERCSLCVCRTG